MFGATPATSTLAFMAVMCNAHSFNYFNRVPRQTQKQPHKTIRGRRRVVQAKEEGYSAASYLVHAIPLRNAVGGNVGRLFPPLI
uniref:Putative secreted protein n=1 Tax=Ixodes ricinus TaxID=34613 RepID=A0A6B0UEN4_IXORI